MITAKIDVTKIDKSKLFEGRNGAKWLDIVLIDTPNNQYGNDYMVVQSTTKEEREAGTRGAILGNAKNTHKDRGGRPAHRPEAEPAEVQEKDDVPF